MFQGVFFPDWGLGLRAEHYVDKCNNLDKKYQFLETDNLPKLKQEETDNLILGFYPKEWKIYLYTKTHRDIRAISFIITKVWKQTRCPSVCDRRNKSKGVLTNGILFKTKKN